MNEAIPTADRLPLLGSALDVGRDPFGFIEEAVETHGPVFRVSVPGFSFVCYADADLVERVFSGEATRYRKDPRELETLGEALGDGLLTARGETWERGRKRVQPAFYPGRLAEYARDMLDRAEATVAEWEDGERIDAYEESTRLTLSIAATTMFGVDEVAEAEVVAEAGEAIASRFGASRVPVEVPLWVPTPSNRRYRRATDELDDVIADLIERRRREAAEDGADDDAEDGGDDRTDLCTELVAAGESGALSDEEIRDQLLTMLFAGHETTAIALTYALGLLASHPDERERVIEEVRGPESIDPRTDLPRTDRAITEALRLYPPAYMIHRETVEDDTVAGYEIPAGTRVVLPVWGIHRSDRYYDDPLEFRPDRWTDGTEESLPEYAYFPFGGGKRRCIGQRFALLELRLALATILRSVRVEETPETDLSPTAALTARPDGPVWLRVRR